MEGILALIGDKKELYSRCFRQTTRPLQDAAFYRVCFANLATLPNSIQNGSTGSNVSGNPRMSESFQDCCIINNMSLLFAITLSVYRSALNCHFTSPANTL